MSNAFIETDYVRGAWKGVIRLYRYNTLPLDAHLYNLYKFDKDGYTLFDVLGAERNRDDSLRDIYLFHLHPLLQKGLEEMDQGQTRKTLEQIKTRYATLNKLFPESIYGSAPSWFTGQW